MASNNDSFGKTIAVAVAVCLVASVVVSFAAVKLKPVQQTNKLLDMQSNILVIAGLDIAGKSGDEIGDMFRRNIETRVVDIATGKFTDAVDAQHYDQRKAAKDPAQNVALSEDEDIAKIKTRAKYASVYLVKNGNAIKSYILPVHGYGLWSTLYGFVAVKPDANTIDGLGFYAHGETPGLGGEVDNPKWKAQWPGKKIADARGDTAIRVVKYGHFDPAAANAAYTIDGLAGASLTTYGVNNLIQFWLGDNGFGPFLDQLKAQSKGE